MSYKIQKLTQLFKNHEWSDCVFIVENEKIPAHKLILAYNSPVFEMMLYGKLSSSEIDITDIKSKDFKVMLEYIYTDNIKIESITQAWNMIYVGQKYFLNDLIKICIDYINNNLNIKDLLMCYELSQMYGQKKLTEMCFRDILMNVKEIFHLTDYHMKIDTLFDILNEKDYTNIDDDTLMLNVLNWIEDECRIQKLAIINENIYQIAKNNGLLKYIRYISNNVNDIKNDFKKQTCKLRNFYKISKKLLFTRPLSLTTLFNVDKKCFISGLSILTQHRPSTAISDKYFGGVNVKIAETNDNQIIAETEIRNDYFQYDDYVSLYFTDLLIVSPKLLYQIIVTYYLENNSEGEILLNFFCSKLNGCNNTNFEFFDEFDGSVLNGISSYPV